MRWHSCCWEELLTNSAVYTESTRQRKLLCVCNKAYRHGVSDHAQTRPPSAALHAQETSLRCWMMMRSSLHIWASHLPLTTFNWLVSISPDLPSCSSAWLLP